MRFHRAETLAQFERILRGTEKEAAEHAAFLQALIPAEERDFFVHGYSYTAGQSVDFLCDFKWSGAAFPAVNWRERVVCPVTGLNNRMRAAIHVVDAFAGLFREDRVYAMEQTTAVYAFLKRSYPNLIGSEFLGDAIPLGSENAAGIRNEDATRLTFASGSVKAVLSFDVFEHIYDYRAAFRESFRVLAPGGVMIFTVPFAARSAQNIERAILNPGGDITHLLPPEYHGDPLSTGGVLCFRHYGWQMLRDLRDVGFSEAHALIFHSREMGYFTDQLIFFCKRALAS